MIHDHKLSFRLDHALWVRLTALCKAVDVKPSEIIREALDFYMAYLSHLGSKK